LKRKVKIIQKGNHDKIVICIDDQNSSEILQYIFSSNVFTEYMIIQSLIFEQIRIKEKYCKADVSNKAKDVFEMRFTNSGRNDRIYCKEQSLGSKRYIIMIELYQSKKTENISNKFKNRIQTIGGYEYEL